MQDAFPPRWSAPKGTDVVFERVSRWYVARIPSSLWKEVKASKSARHGDDEPVGCPWIEW